MTATNARNRSGIEPLSLQLYRCATRFGKPLIDHLLARRLARAKEDGARINERKGIPSRDRPPGVLIWCHAASVGESLALLALIDRLLAQHKTANVLVTTGTLTSAKLMADHLPPRAVHQFVPVDHPDYVSQFLSHWAPDLALWIESELWPNLLSQTRGRDIPMALINARMSDGSFRRWGRAPRAIHSLLDCFDICLAQDEITVDRLSALGAERVVATGNLKFAASPLAAAAEELSVLERAMAQRHAWLAASTHPGEEEIVALAHDLLKDQWPDLLTTIVPRHPELGQSVAQELSNSKHIVALRSRSEPITPETEIYVADTLGELGLFYRANPVTFVGGSLVKHGGQNPLEPARLNSAILHGPHVQNFTQIYEDMIQHDATVKVETADELAKAVSTLVKDSNKREDQIVRARQIVADADGVLNRTLGELHPLLVELDDVRFA